MKGKTLCNTTLNNLENSIYWNKIVLGEIIYEHTGKIIGQRVLDVEGPKIETSFRATGKFKGTDITETTTYWSVPRPGGALYGEAQGVVMTNDGSGEIATLTAQGIGRFTGPGGKCKLSWFCVLSYILNRKTSLT
jgi:hypothetical protein